MTRAAPSVTEETVAAASAIEETGGLEGYVAMGGGPVLPVSVLDPNSSLYPVEDSAPAQGPTEDSAPAQV